jgi:magnesium-transporting ATPase (P-type)
MQRLGSHRRELHCLRRRWKGYRSAQIIQIILFSSERKAVGAVVKLAHGYCLYVKGTSEILTKLCRWHIIVHQQGGPADRGFAVMLN